jgi:hypothetical protein
MPIDPFAKDVTSHFGEPCPQHCLRPLPVFRLSTVKMRENSSANSTVLGSTLLQTSQGFTLEIFSLSILLEFNVTCTNVAVASRIGRPFEHGGFSL